MLAGPLARSIVSLVCGRGGLGETVRSVLGLVPFFVVGGLRGSGKRGPRPGDVGGTCWVLVRVRHHGPLRLAHICWVSVACAGHIDAFPAGVPDRQALVGCVARSRFVGLYEGVLWGKVGLPGLVAVDGQFCSLCFDAPRRGLWREAVIPGPPYRLLPCGWPLGDLHRACAAVCRCFSAGGRLRLAGHACAAFGGAGRSRQCRPACSSGCVPGSSSRWLSALGGFPRAARGRCGVY